MTPEGKIKAKVNRRVAPYIASGQLWKFMPVQMGMGSPALDFLFCAGGFFVAIETKVKGGKRRLTSRQEITKAAMENAGAVVFVVDDDDSLNAAMHVIEKLVARGALRGVLSCGS